MTCKYCGRELVDGVCPVCSKKSVEEKINDAYKNLGRQMSGKISVEEEERQKAEIALKKEEERKEKQRVLEKIQKSKAYQYEKNQKVLLEIERQKQEYIKEKKQRKANGEALRIGLFPWITSAIVMILSLVIMFLTCFEPVYHSGGYIAGVYKDAYVTYKCSTELCIAIIIGGLILSFITLISSTVLVNLKKSK